MSEAWLYGIGAAGLVVGLIVMASVRIVNEYERGVIFRLGRVMGAKGPGLFLIVPIIDRMVKVNLQTVTTDIPPQDVITKDNVTLRVNAVTCFNVVDPVRAVVAVQNDLVATSQIAQTTLRSILGRPRRSANQAGRDQCAAPADHRRGDQPLGGEGGARRGEGRRAAGGHAARHGSSGGSGTRASGQGHTHRGRVEAAASLAEAATTLQGSPGAMQLRLLSTMTEVAAEKNSTLIFPVPVELLRFAEHAGTAGEHPTGASM